MCCGQLCAWAHHEGTLGVALYLHAFLISTLDGDKWSVLRFGRFAPSVSIAWKAGMSKAGLGALWKTEISRHCRESNADSSVFLSVA